MAFTHDTVLALLHERPALVDTLADWFEETWPDWYGRFPAGRASADLRERLHSDRWPLTLIALRAGAPIGTVSITTSSIASHTHLAPWLTALYVVPSARGRGLGGDLVEAAVGQALRLGAPTVFIALSVAQLDRYAARGWETLEVFQHDGEALGVLSRRTF